MSTHENNPFSADASPGVEDKKDTKDSKKKSSKEKRLGAFLVKPEAAEQSDSAEKEGSLKSLFSRSEKAKDAEEGDSTPELTPDEAEFIEKELSHAEGDVLAKQQKENLPLPEQYEAEQVEAFYDRIRHENKDSDTALAETLSDIDAEQEPLADNETANEPTETLEEDTTNEATQENQHSFDTENIPEHSDADDEPVIAAGAGGGAGAGGNTNPPTGGAGGGNQPPNNGQPPRRPQRTAAVAPAAMFPAVANPNVAPAMPQAAEVQYDPNNAVGAAVLGGIVGYLIGRRRGRIKTEKKLLPVQKKLEKEVTGLQEQLKAKEQQVRKAARAKVAQEPRVLERVVSQRAETTPVAKNVQKEAAVVESVTRAVAPEAAAIHAKQPAPERIGKVLVTAEVAPKAIRLETNKHEEKVPVSKHVETMNRAELLAMSDKIIIDGSSLRQIYETHLVGERGLRRLVSEHLRGGNLKKALRREVVEREIDFERDPVMRDLSPSGGGGGRSDSSTPASVQLQALVQKAAASLPSESDEVAFLKARAKFEEKEQARQRQRQNIMDVSMSSTILLLVVIIAYLLIRNT